MSWQQTLKTARFGETWKLLMLDAKLSFCYLTAKYIIQYHQRSQLDCLLLIFGGGVLDAGSCQRTVWQNKTSYLWARIFVFIYRKFVHFYSNARPGFLMRSSCLERCVLCSSFLFWAAGVEPVQTTHICLYCTSIFMIYTFTTRLYISLYYKVIFLSYFGCICWAVSVIKDIWSSHLFIAVIEYRKLANANLPLLKPIGFRDVLKTPSVKNKV